MIVRPTGKQLGLPLTTGHGPFRELCRLDDFKNSQSRTCRLSADGKFLVAAGSAPKRSKEDEPKGQICIWDLSGLFETARRQTPKLTKEDRERLWEELFLNLADSGNPTSIFDKAGAFYQHQVVGSQRAMATLVAHPDEALGWLRKRMGPPFDVQRITRYLDDLDSDRHVLRAAASRELGRMPPDIRPILETALRENPSLDKKLRLEQLLDRFRATPVCYGLQILRIIDVLEHMPARQAREILQLIADGRYGADYALDAKRALARCVPSAVPPSR